MNPPSEASPLWMQCLACGGSGCGDCDGRGKVPIKRCPMSMIGPDVWELVGLAGDAESGFLPVAGGTLNQTHSFMTAWRQFRSEKAQWKAQLGAKDNGHG